MAIVKASNPLKQEGELRVNQKRAKHIATLAGTIFGQSRHLHGLTKPCLNLVHAAALATTLETPKSGSVAEARTRLLRNEKLRLTRSQQAIVLRALEIEPDHVDADAVAFGRSQPIRAPRGKACRPALPPFSRLPRHSARWAPRN